MTLCVLRLKISNFLPTHFTPYNYTSKFLSSSTDSSMLMKIKKSPLLLNDCLLLNIIRFSYLLLKILLRYLDD